MSCQVEKPLEVLIHLASRGTQGNPVPRERIRHELRHLLRLGSQPAPRAVLEVSNPHEGLTIEPALAVRQILHVRLLLATVDEHQHINKLIQLNPGKRREITEGSSREGLAPYSLRRLSVRLLSASKRGRRFRRRWPRARRVRRTRRSRRRNRRHRRQLVLSGVVPPASLLSPAGRPRSSGRGTTGGSGGGGRGSVARPRRSPLRWRKCTSLPFCARLRRRARSRRSGGRRDAGWSGSRRASTTSRPPPITSSTRRRSPARYSGDCRRRSERREGLWQGLTPHTRGLRGPGRRGSRRPGTGTPRRLGRRRSSLCNIRRSTTRSRSGTCLSSGSRRRRSLRRVSRPRASARNPSGLLLSTTHLAAAPRMLCRGSDDGASNGDARRRGGGAARIHSSCTRGRIKIKPSSRNTDADKRNIRVVQQTFPLEIVIERLMHLLHNHRRIGLRHLSVCAGARSMLV